MVTQTFNEGTKKKKKKLRFLKISSFAFPRWVWNDRRVSKLGRFPFLDELTYKKHITQQQEMTVHQFFLTLFSWIRGMNHTLKVEGHMFMSHIITNAKLFNIRIIIKQIKYELVTFHFDEPVTVQGCRSIATNGRYNQWKCRFQCRQETIS